MIGKSISHYTILEKIGEGGMGVVYKAEDTKLKRLVALKFLPGSTLADRAGKERLFHEARAAAALRHPGICTVHDIEEVDGRVFIAMDYLEGQTLRDKIAKGPLRVEEAIGVTTQIAEALEAAHQKDIIHRDIKPENVMVTERGEAVLMDFGLAKSWAATAKTKTGAILGTATYMSPEQAQGFEVDHRTDIWSLGALLYEMIGGRPPFQSDLPQALVYSIISQDPVPLTTLRPGVPEGLERIVRKLLAKVPDDRHQSAAELVTDLENIRAGAVPPAGKRVLWRVALPAVVILLAFVLIIMITDPLNLRTTPDRRMVPEENILAIMYFDNLAQPGDPQRLGEIITNLLITSLSQSQDLRVVSSQRLYDILKLQGMEGTKVINRTSATAIAKEAGARWMMLGSILQVNPHLVVTHQLVDVASGNIETSQRLTGTPDETVFQLVDRMTGNTQLELVDPVRLDVEQPPPVMEVTTSSLDAYRYYLEGLELRNKYYMEEARQCFRRAIEHDSTFAMAHYWYARSALLTSTEQDMKSALNNAVRYAKRASEKERLYIMAQKNLSEFRYQEAADKLSRIVERYPDEKEAYLIMAQIYRDWDNQKSLEYYQQVLSMDPLEKRTYQKLAYLYDDLGNTEKSIWAINQYLQLAPDEADPHDSRGDLYAFNGDIQNAIDSYRKALEIKPNFLASQCKLGHMLLFAGRYDEAQNQYRKLVASDLAPVRSRGRIYPSSIPLYQGKLREALNNINFAIAADEMENYFSDWHPNKYYQRAKIYIYLGQYDRAAEDIQHWLDLSKSIYSFSDILIYEAADIWIFAGRLEYADSLTMPYDAVVDTLDQIQLHAYHYAKGMVALHRGDMEKACGHLEKVDSLFPNDYKTRYWLATAYLEKNRTSEAIALLEGILNRYDWSRFWEPYLAVKGYYLLGTAYQNAGNDERAVESFQTFLHIWNEADPELKEIADAQKRLNELVVRNE
jgi:tetratricopeptide (TPR) repeat protein/TolB-like protein